jgi:hypothetical protein
MTEDREFELMRRASMRKLNTLVLSACLCIAPQLATAGDFDGSTPLICAVLQAFECAPESGCEAGPPASMNLPQFIRVDFVNKKISATRPSGEKQVSAVSNLERVDGGTILQGAENSRGWSMVIAEETGTMSATAAGGDVAFVLFGACTPR